MRGTSRRSRSVHALSGSCLRHLKPVSVAFRLVLPCRVAALLVLIVIFIRPAWLMFTSMVESLFLSFSLSLLFLSFSLSHLFLSSSLFLSFSLSLSLLSFSSFSLSLFLSFSLGVFSQTFARPGAFCIVFHLDHAA